MNKISLMSILALMGIMITGVAVIGTNNPYITRNTIPGGSPFLPYNPASVAPAGNTAYSHQVFPQYHLETSSNSTSTTTITITSSTTTTSNNGDYNYGTGNSTSSAQSGSAQPPSSDSGNGHHHHSKG